MNVEDNRDPVHVAFHVFEQKKAKCDAETNGEHCYSSNGFDYPPTDGKHYVYCDHCDHEKITEAANA